MGNLRSKSPQVGEATEEAKTSPCTATAFWLRWNIPSPLLLLSSASKENNFSEPFIIHWDCGPLPPGPAMPSKLELCSNVGIGLCRASAKYLGSENIPPTVIPFRPATLCSVKCCFKRLADKVERSLFCYFLPG